MKNRGIMNRCPMILKVHMDLEKFTKPFQYFNYIRKVEGFQNAINKAWSTTWFGDPMGILCRKLKFVKKERITLNRVHGNVHNNVHNARQRLNVIQDQLVINPTDVSLVKKEHEASSILEFALVE